MTGAIVEKMITGDIARRGGDRNFMKNCLLMLALFGPAAQAWAIDMNGFKGTPIAQLAADEKKAFHTALVQVLNQVPDRSSVDWKAPRTKLASRITPVKSFDEGQLRCRETLIEANAQTGQHHGTNVFCRNVKGEWQFRKPVSKAGVKK